MEFLALDLQGRGFFLTASPLSTRSFLASGGSTASHAFLADGRGGHGGTTRVGLACAIKCAGGGAFGECVLMARRVLAAHGVAAHGSAAHGDDVHTVLVLKPSLFASAWT